MRDQQEPAEAADHPPTAWLAVLLGQSQGPGAAEQSATPCPSPECPLGVPGTSLDWQVALSN